MDIAAGKAHGIECVNEYFQKYESAVRTGCCLVKNDKFSAQKISSEYFMA